MGRPLSQILPTLPLVFGLSEPEAAASVGVSQSKFRELVADGRMPRARRIDGRLVYDVDELRAAFKAMPHVGDRPDAESGEPDGQREDTWADL